MIKHTHHYKNMRAMALDLSPQSGEKRILMEHVNVPNIHKLDVYQSKGGYQALKKTVGAKMDREALIKEVQGSNVRRRISNWK